MTTKQSKTRKKKQANEEFDDEILSLILDEALNAAEGELAHLLARKNGHFSPEDITEMFLRHADTHLLTELENIKSHGYKEDN